MGVRQDSLHFPDLQIAELEAFEKSKLTLGIDFMPHGFRGDSEDNAEAGSLYFTPTGTPMREMPPATALPPPQQRKSSVGKSEGVPPSGGGGSDRSLNKSASLKNTPTREPTDPYRWEFFFLSYIFARWKQHKHTKWLCKHNRIVCMHA